MADKGRSAADGSGEVAELLNRGVESLALLLELINALKAKGIFTEEEIGDMGKRAETLRVEIFKGQLPS
jgi:hypothetical protein